MVSFPSCWWLPRLLLLGGKTTPIVMQCLLLLLLLLLLYCTMSFYAAAAAVLYNVFFLPRAFAAALLWIPAIRLVSLMFGHVRALSYLIIISHTTPDVPLA